MQTVGIDREFWSGRRVFVTGHTGFIGGWMCAWLDRLGARVEGYALAPPEGPSFHRANGHVADIRDRAALAAAVAECDPEIVVHLAAQPLVRKAHAEPIETFEVNVMGTANLLEALRAAPSAKAAVIMTTDKVYRNDELERGYREDDVLGGREPYGCGKACAEHVVDAYRESYFAGAGLGVATVRAGNVIGGGDWAEDRLIPDAVRAFASGRTLEIRNPGAIRPWQHALDPVRGILMLAQRLSNEPAAWTCGWNFADRRRLRRTLGQRRPVALRRHRRQRSLRSQNPQVGRRQGGLAPRLAPAVAPGARARGDGRMVPGAPRRPLRRRADATADLGVRRVELTCPCR
jgi:CDP-glucose 4,6-dehydratase